MASDLTRAVPVHNFVSLEKSDYRFKKMHYMDLFSKAGNIFRQPRALQTANDMLQGNVSLTPSKLFDWFSSCFTNVSDGYESSSDQGSYSETSSASGKSLSWKGRRREAGSPNKAKESRDRSEDSLL
uniref:Uncharacterized protein n=1 Tax=Brassica oleracea TaxID=3712 RepID=A0A3P6DLI2_BRAOL|nr:unnamed protein product [Brassica oleracea]